MTRRGWRGHTRLTRRRAIELIGLGGLGTLLAACGAGRAPTAPAVASAPANAGGPDFAARFAGYEAADEPEGDLAKVVWPEFVTRAGPEIQRLYAFQVTNGALMRYMPCFCGCHKEDGHRNNRDCYIDTVNADGSVVFDAMAPT